MTEPEVIASVTDLAEIATNFVSLWLSVTFAYLTVAYFLSKALSRFQYFAASALYGFTSIWFILCAWIYTEMAILIARREEERNIFDQRLKGSEFFFLSFLRHLRRVETLVHFRANKLCII